MNHDGSMVIVSARGPYTVAPVTQDDAGTPRITWSRGAGGLAQGGIPLTRGTQIISTAKSPDDLVAQALGVQPPKLAEQGVTQRFLMANRDELLDHGEFFGRVTWFVHHDKFVGVSLTDTGTPLATTGEELLTAAHVTKLYDGHVQMNRLAACTVIDAVNEMCDATPGLMPHEIPVLVQDHHFDLVPNNVAREWTSPENPRRELPPPHSALFLHTSVASAEQWAAFHDFVPDVVTRHAAALAKTQIATHDTTWADRLVTNLQYSLGPEATIVAPWAGPYPPSAQRTSDIVETSAFANDRSALLATAAGRRIVGVVSRVDPPKNLPQIVEAFSRMLERHPELQHDVVLVVQTGSGREFPEYRQELRSLERAVVRANADAEVHGELLPVKLETDGSPYRATAIQLEADVIAFVSTIDGFGHVALEGAHAGSKAALVMSPNTGAARWIRAHAPDTCIEVDPFDLDSMADGLAEALALDPAERVRRAELLSETATELVQRAPVWADEQVRWAQAPAVVRALQHAFTHLGGVAPGPDAFAPSLGIG